MNKSFYLRLLFQDEELQSATIMALALNHVGFLELLLNYYVSVSSILTKPLLEFLYGYASRINLSPIKEMFNDSDYSKIEKTYNHLHTVKKLCNYAGQDTTRCCIPIPKIRKIVKKFCSRLINKEHQEFMKVT